MDTKQDIKKILKLKTLSLNSFKHLNTSAGENQIDERSKFSREVLNMNI